MLRWFRELCVLSTVVSVLIALSFLATACASSAKLKSRANDVMNRVTDVADPSYSLAVVACDGREGQLIEACRKKGDGCDTEELRREVGESRGVCDRIFQGFETLRIAQVHARELVAAAGEDEDAWSTVLAASEEALGAWKEVRALIMETPWIAGGSHDR